MSRLLMLLCFGTVSFISSLSADADEIDDFIDRGLIDISSIYVVRADKTSVKVMSVLYGREVKFGQVFEHSIVGLEGDYLFLKRKLDDDYVWHPNKCRIVGQKVTIMYKNEKGVIEAHLVELKKLKARLLRHFKNKKK